LLQLVAPKLPTPTISRARTIQPCCTRTTRTNSVQKSSFFEMELHIQDSIFIFIFFHIIRHTAHSTQFTVLYMRMHTPEPERAEAELRAVGQMLKKLNTHKIPECKCKKKNLHLLDRKPGIGTGKLPKLETSSTKFCVLRARKRAMFFSTSVSVRSPQIAHLY